MSELITLSQKQFQPYIRQVELEQILENLAEKINEDYQDSEVVVLGVLDGVILFLSDLIRRLKINLSVELVKLKSYDGTQSSGEVKQLVGVTSDLQNKKILVVEDIIDTGLTLTHLLQTLKKHGCESIEIVTLLLKEDVFKEKFPIKYVGKKIENKFVVGYGMDIDGAGRQLPEIYVATE